MLAFQPMTRMRLVRSHANGETTRIRDAHLKGSRWLTLHRVGIEADPVPVSRQKQKPMLARPEPAHVRERPEGEGPR